MFFCFVFLQEPSSNLHFLGGGFFNSLVRLDGGSVGKILLGSTGICFVQEPSSNLRFLHVVGGFFNSLIGLGGISAWVNYTKRTSNLMLISCLFVWYL